MCTHIINPQINSVIVAQQIIACAAHECGRIIRQSSRVLHAKLASIRRLELTLLNPSSSLSARMLAAKDRAAGC
jgi:hypothetical protein